MRPTARTLLLCALAIGAGGCGSSGGGASPGPGADLSGFRIARIRIDGIEFEAYFAETPAQRAQGFMFATMDQATPLPDGTPRGMLFVFAGDVMPSFFMRNTFIALDLAYLRSDGLLVEMYPLVPLNETLVPAGQPVRYAFEALSGTLAAYGIGPGSVMVVPPG